MPGHFYSVLTLQTWGDDPNSPVRTLKAGGYETYQEMNLNSIEHSLFATQASHTKKYVTSRKVTAFGVMVGEAHSNDLTEKILHELFWINYNSTKDEQEANSYATLVNEKVAPYIPAGSSTIVSVKSSQPKWLLFTRNVPIYFLGVLTGEGLYVLVSNDLKVEDKVKTLDNKPVFLYRMPSCDNGMCVIQTNAFHKRMLHWNNIMRDKLKVMNAIERYLSHRWLH